MKYLTITAPAGPLEAILEGDAEDAEHVAVICHPHPLHGGTMRNKVVYMLAKAFATGGAVTIRFNFRGVGASEGEYGEGLGETDDALAVLDWAQQRWPSAALWLGGFSFGGAVAIRAAARRSIERLVTVAPAVDRIGVETDRLPQGAWLLVHGDRDELVDADAVVRWANALKSPPRVVLLPGVDHFFHGRLNDLRDVVVEWLKSEADRG